MRTWKMADFNTKTLEIAHHRTTYRGVPCIKCPFDYVMYQMIISQIQPDLIIEIGTQSGGSALYMADLLNNLGKGIIHTINIADETNGNELVANHPRIKRFIEGYQGYDLNLANGFESVLIIEDGSHTYQDVIGALRKFKNIVTPNSYLIVEDGIISELGYEGGFDGGPVRAIDEFLGENQNYMLDEWWCNFYGQSATFNTNGFLKRIF